MDALPLTPLAPGATLSATVAGAINGVLDLDAVGAAIRAAAFGGASASAWPTLDPKTVLLTGASDERVSPTAAYAVVVSHLQHLVESGDYAERTLVKYAFHLTKFTAYLERRWPTPDIRSIGRDHALAWVNSPTLGRETRPPKPRTRENRRDAAEAFFRTLRSLNLYTGDPFTDVEHEARPGGTTRPLTDAEIARCRRHAARTTRDTLGPARLALASATATSSEAPEITRRDVHLSRGGVWLPGGARTIGRWGHLDEWEIAALDRHLQSLPDDPATPLVYKGHGGPEHREAAACAGIRAILDRAGLNPDPTVVPKSIRAWRGRCIYDETGDIELVAHRLGLHSLDIAREQLGCATGCSDIPPPAEP